MQENRTMAKTKTDDLPKGTEAMSAGEQKAAKGGAKRLATIQATAVIAPTLADKVATSIEDAPTLDTTLRKP